jgi:hypothetical protein
VIRLLDWQTDQPDALTISGAEGSRCTLDGLLVTGRGVRVNGDLAELCIRHCTLVPGWSLGHDCSPQRATGASLEIQSPRVCVRIERSILGAIQVEPHLVRPIEGDEADDTPLPDETPTGASEVTHVERPPQEAAVEARCRGIGRGVRLDPLRICIADSLLDATDPEQEALGAPGCPVAHAVLTIARCTVFGRIQAHAVELGENSIFIGIMTVARRQLGCLRFCYVTPGSRTPRRYECQPESAVQTKTAALLAEIATRLLTVKQKTLVRQAQAMEARRVEPHFESVRYGQPAYGRLSRFCADEIVRGAEDESEMGVFHDLYQPQRGISLKVRLNEYIPAGMDVGVIFSS